jgi:hypothetical protein
LGIADFGGASAVPRHVRCSDGWKLKHDALLQKSECVVHQIKYIASAIARKTSAADCVAREIRRARLQNLPLFYVAAAIYAVNGPVSEGAGGLDAEIESQES